MVNKVWSFLIDIKSNLKQVGWLCKWDFWLVAFDIVRLRMKLLRFFTEMHQNIDES